MKLIDPDLSWYVVRCRTGVEERCWLELRAGGFDCYFPRARKQKFVGRVCRLRRTVESAALPGHVFVAGPVDWAKLYSDIDNRPREAVEHQGRVYIVPRGIETRHRFEHVGKPLGDANGPLRIPGKLVEQISIDEMAGKFDETGATKKANRVKLKERFPAGLPVRVGDGPFMGLFAQVAEVTAKERIRALVSLFGRMTEVEFDPDQLDAA